MQAIESADIRQAVRRTGWLMVLDALASDALAPALRRPGRHVPCPVHGDGRNTGRGDGFRLFPDVDRTGGGICATCGAYPDGLALLQWLFGWSFPQTLARVASVLGLVGASSRPLVPGFARTDRCQVLRPDPERVRRSLRRAWCESLDPTHPGAASLRRYLAGRGLDAGVLNPRIVRFHPALPYWDRDADDRPLCLGRFPAMLALVSDADGRPVTLHRTYLRADGSGKAPVPSPKKLMAHARYHTADWRGDPAVPCRRGGEPCARHRRGHRDGAGRAGDDRHAGLGLRVSDAVAELPAAERTSRGSPSGPTRTARGLEHTPLECFRSGWATRWMFASCCRTRRFRPTPAVSTGRMSG